MRRLPFAYAILILTAGSLGAALGRNLIELFFMAELVSIAFFYIFFSVIVPAIFPRRVKADAIFLGGATKPPYVRSEEIYTPQLPLISGKIDRTWELYYDAKKFKPYSKEVTR